MDGRGKGSGDIRRNRRKKGSSRSRGAAVATQSENHKRHYLHIPPGARPPCWMGQKIQGARDSIRLPHFTSYPIYFRVSNDKDRLTNWPLSQTPCRTFVWRWRLPSLSPNGRRYQLELKNRCDLRRILTSTWLSPVGCATIRPVYEGTGAWPGQTGAESEYPTGTQVGYGAVTRAPDSRRNI